MARLGAVLAPVAVVSAGFLAPSASATTMADTPLPCQSMDGGYYCDLNDVAGLLSGVLDPVLQLTCTVPSTIGCRVNTDNAPYSD